MGERTGVRRHGEEMIWLGPVAVVSVLLLVAGELAGAGDGIAATSLLADYGRLSLRALPLLLQLMLIALLARGLLSRGSSPLQATSALLRTRFGSLNLSLAAAAPILLMPVLLAGYGALKILLPLHVPFAWDDSFAAADRLLFFGYQPWQLTHALFGGPAATLAIDRIYTLWVALLSFAIIGFALAVPRYDRARFFLSFTAAWVILGVAGAYLGSSAGPCYTALVGASSAGDYAALMARLREYSESYATLGAVEWQAVLWDAHANRNYSAGMGISAMPSLHNAIAVLYALALARFGRVWAIAGWLFAAAIFAGSIHLAWHYAVDGLVSSVAMVGIWWLAGRYLDRSGYAAAVRETPAEGETAPPQPALA